MLPSLQKVQSHPGPGASRRAQLTVGTVAGAAGAARAAQTALLQNPDMQPALQAPRGRQGHQQQRGRGRESLRSAEGTRRNACALLC